MARPHITALALLAALSWCPVARAQPSDAERAVAREQGYRGVELFQAGKYDEALALLDRADALVPAPTVGLWRARALEKVGRLVEASQLLFDVGRRPLPELEREVHRQAQADAKTELAALEPRIPKLTITVEGAAPSDVAVSLAGEPVASSLLGVAMPADPGEVHVIAQRGDEPAQERRVTLAEGARETIALTFAPADPAPVVAPTPVVAPAPTTPAPMLLAPAAPPPANSADSVDELWVTGWALTGLGALGLGLGIGAAVSGASTRDGIEPSCVDQVCDALVQDDVDHFNRMRVASTVGFVAGGLLLAGGVVLLVLSPNDEDAAMSIAASPGGLSFTARY